MGGNVQSLSGCQQPLGGRLDGLFGRLPIVGRQQTFCEGETDRTFTVVDTTELSQLLVRLPREPQSLIAAPLREESARQQRHGKRT